MAKMGRPKLDNAKHKRIGIRLSDDDYQKLSDYCEKHNMTISETMMKAFELLINKEEEMA